MKRTFGILLIFTLIFSTFAQAKPATSQNVQKLVLEYVDGSELSVIEADGSILKLNAGIFEGDPLPLGSTISTGPNTTAELKLTPNGTLIKIARSTLFTLTSLASSAQDKNAFTLVAGKIRAVAAKGGNYELKTQTAVCGVRGTDFILLVEEGKRELLTVVKGLVAMQKIDAVGAIIAEAAVGAGKAVDALAPLFEAFAIDEKFIAEQFGDMGFTRLDETAVPQYEETTSDMPSTPEPEAAAASVPPPAPSAPTSPDPTPPEAAMPEEPKSDESLTEAPQLPDTAFVKWFRDFFGMEIGSITINDTTYSKAVIQPNLKLGKFKLGLYLPVIYSSNLFDPNDWYKPRGNNEWSFGAGLWGSDNLAAALDAAADLALKIKYLEIGRQLEDPFFVKAGSLDSLTLGHGLIMRNFANDSEFPAVRRIGFNLGLSGSGGGFEALVNDLTQPEIFGFRAFLRPIKGFKLAIGLSAAADIGPAWSLSAAQRQMVGDPILLGSAIDLDLPIISSDFLMIRLFADGAVNLPYLRQAIGGKKDLRYDLVYNDGDFRNWGAASGLLARIAILDLRLEYRYFTGIFKPSLFDGAYALNRASYALLYKGYLDGSIPISSSPSIMGVYGEGGVAMFDEKLTLYLGYFWPWSIVTTNLADALAQAKDEAKIKLEIRRGLIPFVDLSGSILYERRGVAKALSQGNFVLLDENTVFAGEILIPIPKTPNLDLALIVKSVPVRSANGTIAWKDESKGIPYVKPSVGIETRLHF